MFATSAITLDAKAYRSNLRFIRSRMNPGAQLCSVVKGNAYGHGLEVFVRMALDASVGYFAVHSAEEAYAIKPLLPSDCSLFIMGSMEPGALEWAVAESVEFAVFDEERLIRSVEVANQVRRPAKIHLELETGMHRTGFRPDTLPGLVRRLQDHRQALTCKGVFTHLAGAESMANDFRVRGQIETFRQGLNVLRNAGVHPKWIHTACSAGLINYPDAPGNMVRIGILQYGFWPNQETFVRFYGDRDETRDALRRVIRWTSRVMALQEVRKGRFIGYGSTFLSHKDMRLAIIPVGYAHGYSRSLSNTGCVLINGRKAPVVGTVNMNSLTVDISTCGTVNKGDEVVLIGKQGNHTITVNSFSEQSHLLNYEMLARLPASIPRMITQS
jgi:alanine racemase